MARTLCSLMGRPKTVRSYYLTPAGLTAERSDSIEPWHGLFIQFYFSSTLLGWRPISSTDPAPNSWQTFMVCYLNVFAATLHLLTQTEPFDAPIREEQVVRWSLPIAAKSAFTSLNRTSADQAWGQIEMNQNRT